jgi:hypothetical protein
MAKVTIKFLAVDVDDEQLEAFLKNMEEVLRRFAGNAYNFRYDVERASLKRTVKGSEKIN